MKKMLFLLVLFGFIQQGISQQTENREVGHFDGIGVSEGISVYLKKGPQESLRIETSGMSTDQVATDLSGSYLKVHMRNGRHNQGSVKVYVTYTDLKNLYASSAASIYIDGVLEANSLKIGSSSAGSIEIKIKVDKLQVDVSSAGDVELAGTAMSADVEASTSGELDAYDLEVGAAVISAVTAGSVKITVKDSIEATASTGADIRYRGNPSRAITHSTTGGSVRKSG